MFERENNPNYKYFCYTICCCYCHLKDTCEYKCRSKCNGCDGWENREEPVKEEGGYYHDGGWYND